MKNKEWVNNRYKIEYEGETYHTLKDFGKVIGYKTPALHYHIDKTKRTQTINIKNIKFKVTILKQKKNYKKI